MTWKEDEGRVEEKEERREGGGGGEDGCQKPVLMSRLSAPEPL